MQQKISTRSQARKIYEQIRDMIAEEALLNQPGEFIDSENSYAARFGVSRATVRKAVDELIKVSIVKRVPGKGLAVAAESPRQENRKLLISLPFTIGDGYFYNVTMGCIQMANDLGYDYKILNCCTPAERLDKFMSELLSEYAGIIMTVYESMEDAKIIAKVKRSGIPYVLVDNRLVGSNDPAILNDDFTGGYMMAEYLANKGHSSILYISSNRPVHTVYERERGFCQGLLDYGIIYGDKSIVRIHDPGIPKWELDTLDDILDTIISQRFTGIAGYSSIPIMSLCSYMLKKGLAVPDLYSLIGFGDITYLDAYNLSLTSVQVESISLGTNAVAVLHDAVIKGNNTVDSMTIGVHIHKGKTVKRVGPALLKKQRIIADTISR